jgi:hypothetical protein
MEENAETGIRAPGRDDEAQQAPPGEPSPPEATGVGQDQSRPAAEPGPARPSEAPEAPRAPEGNAPDLDELQPGSGPGQTPGE